MSHPYLDYFQKETFYPLSGTTNDYIGQKLDEVSSLWSAGELDDIIQVVKKSLDLNLYDIRLVTFYLYSLWSKSECSLYQILQALHQLLEQPSSVWLYEEIEGNDDTHENIALSDANNKQLYRYLQLLFKRIEERLSRYFDQQYSEGSHHCETVNYLNQLAELINEKYNFEDIAALVNKITIYYEDTCEKEKSEQEELRKLEEESIAKDDRSEQKEDSEQENQADNINKETLLSEQPINNHASPALQQLLNKLQIFETLMQTNAFYKAAIVFESIQKELEQFNPLEYFPEYFSNYAKTRAVFATELNQLIQQHQSPQSQALKDYFAIDPNGFIQLEIEQPTLADMNTATTKDNYSYDE